MRVLYVESKLKGTEFKLNAKEISKLPKKIFLAYSIQYKDLGLSVKKQLVSNNITVSKFQQVLGCSKVNTNLPILLVGSGRFHAINLYLQAPAVYLLEGEEIIKISRAEVERVWARKKTALMKFLNADKIGILVSTKPGQENLKKAIELEKKLKKKGKKVYVFICDSVDVNQFENFDVQSWVNTACSGLANDNPQVIDINELPKL